MVQVIGFAQDGARQHARRNSVQYRFALIPQALTVFGMGAALLQVTAVAMPPYGYRVVFLMLLAIALSHIALARWLIAKGFGERLPLASALRE